MLLQTDCIACIVNMATSLIRKLALTEKQSRSLLVDILEIPALRGQRWHVTSPEVIEQVELKIAAAIGLRDPFHKEKRELNRAIFQNYGRFEQQVGRSADPLRTAVNLAVGGNAIDFMLPGGTDGVYDALMEHMKKPLPDPGYRAFERRLRNAKSVLYIGDNAGEIVLDKLLIETILKRFDLDITFVVRSIPTLNDATHAEAAEIGMQAVARVVENGTDGPVPGTVLRRCSPEVRQLADRADLIISKGGGNFDTLSEERPHLEKITFLLLSKCLPYERSFGVERLLPVVGTVYGRQIP